MFYKLKRNNNCYIINSDYGKKPFRSLASFSESEINTVFDFAYRMTFGDEGRHRDQRTGGAADRRNGQKFANTFQGKLGECAIYRELCNLAQRLGNGCPFAPNQISQPNYDVAGLGVWDHLDININRNTASVKSTKYYGQLLLLETGDWDSEGRYLHSMDANRNIQPIAYDYNFLVRISPSCEDIMKHNRLLYSDNVDREELKGVMKQKWEYDIPGFITLSELKYIISNRYILPKGALYGDSETRMDAENYYVRAADMHDISELPKILAGSIDG